MPVLTDDWLHENKNRLLSEEQQFQSALGAVVFLFYEDYRKASGTSPLITSTSDCEERETL